jgi:hypothetical protein
MMPLPPAPGTRRASKSTHQLLINAVKELKSGLPLLQRPCSSTAATDVYQHQVAAVELMTQHGVQQRCREVMILPRLLELANTYLQWYLPGIAASSSSSTMPGALLPTAARSLTQQQERELLVTLPSFQIGVVSCMAVYSAVLSLATVSGDEGAAALHSQLIDPVAGGMRC